MNFLNRNQNPHNNDHIRLNEYMRKLSFFFCTGLDTVRVLPDVVARVDLPILESPSNILQYGIVIFYYLFIIYLIVIKYKKIEFLCKQSNKLDQVNNQFILIDDDG